MSWIGYIGIVLPIWLHLVVTNDELFKIRFVLIQIRDLLRLQNIKPTSEGGSDGK